MCGGDCVRGIRDRDVRRSRSDPYTGTRHEMSGHAVSEWALSQKSTILMDPIYRNFMGHTIGYSSTNFMTHLFSSFRTVFMGPKYSKSVGYKNGEKFTIFVSHIITTSICDFMDQKSAYKITIFLEAIIYAILWARKKWSPRRVGERVLSKRPSSSIASSSNLRVLPKPRSVTDPYAMSLHSPEVSVLPAIGCLAS